MWDFIYEVYPLIFLVVIALHLYEGIKTIRKLQVTNRQKIALAQQLIAATLFFFIILWVTTIGANFSRAILGLLSVLLLYLGFNILINGISLIAFRGNLGPIEDSKAIGMGVLIVTIAIGVIIYSLLVSY